MSTVRLQKGFSLIELMISMTIGIFLIGGALYVYDEAQATMKVNDTLARMQENARWAFNVIEPDLRLGGYWGRHTSGAVIDGRTNSVAPLAAAVAGDCGPNWSIDTDTSVEGFNNVAPAWDCIDGAEYKADSDTIAVRHASGRTIPTAELEAGRIYVRTHEIGRGALFSGGAQPPIADGQNNALVANAYYVRPFTVAGDNLPSLRRKGLTVIGGTPTIVDQEIIGGIEDLQVQLGIDNDGDGSVDRYVNTDNAILGTGPQVRAMRIWLRVRADQPELGFTDDQTYTYADQRFTPAGDEAAFRRLLLSRTIFLRNESILERNL